MLINCVVYRDGKKVADIAPGEIASYVCRPECFVWVALFEPGAEELDAMQQEFGLHELAVEDARHGHQRPKIEEYGDQLFVVMNTVELDGGELNIGEVAVFVGRNYVLSVRSRTKQGLMGVRARCEREPELLRHGSGYVLYAMMDAVVDRYFPVLDALESELEDIERRIFASQNNRDIIEALYNLKQKLTVLKHATGPLLEFAGKLYGGRVPQPCVHLQEYFRDVYDHLIRLNQLADGLRDTVTTAISVNLSLLTIQENEVTKRLAAYAALVAVPTMIAGIYGMNFHHMPELEWALGYPLAIGTMVAIDLYLFYRFRRAKWL
ncbi:MAG TPA: magnesium/cobalt transporter CorA [Burkholderiales bacterium]|nr:magnesium/cobalt transporter CorA [Burkholderiales bacterium]